MRDYLNLKEEDDRMNRPNDADDDTISVDDENEHGGVVVTIGGHAPAGVPVVVVGAGGQVIQTMYHDGEGDDDEDGMDGDDEQEGDNSGPDVTAMTGSLQMTGLADPMPIDIPYHPQQHGPSMHHDMN